MSALRHTAPDGVVYRVLDLVYGVPPARPGQWVRLPLGDPRATARMWFPPAGHEVAPHGHPLYRTYHLGPASGRGTDPATLDAEWARCAWTDIRPVSEILADRAGDPR